jgi:NADPH-dependent 2,4-dienoyl-CoA reductase/sulfur reductase-like enzyme
MSIKPHSNRLPRFESLFDTRYSYIPVPFTVDSCVMAERLSEIRRVAVIGAGVSGVASAVHLRAAGLDITVFERSSKAGGVWCVAYMVNHDH